MSTVVCVEEFDIDCTTAVEYELNLLKVTSVGYLNIEPE